MNLNGNLFRIDYAGGTSGDDVVLTVVTQTTTTTLATDTNAITYGQTTPVTLTATVTTSSGTPTGTVEFFDGTPGSGGTELTSSPLGADGTAIGTVSNLNVAGSPHQLFAVFVPDTTTDYAGSTSAPQPVTVTPATLTVSGVVAQNKQYDSTTTATVDTGGATLNGVVGSDTVTLNSTNVSAAFTSPNVGTNIAVTVSGLSLSGADSSNYVLQQPTGLTANITTAPLTLTADNKSMTQGSAVPTLTYTATGLQGSDTTSVLTTQPTLTTTATSTSPVGTYPITISGGTAHNYTITDLPGTLSVVAAQGTTTSLSLSSQYNLVGNPVTFTATVSPTSAGEGTPSGTVQFYSGSTLLGTQTLNTSTGQASFTTSSQSEGSFPVSAQFVGDPPFANSTSATQTVNFASSFSTTTTLTSSSQLPEVGDPVTYTATVTTPSPYAPTPTGSVVFTVNGNAIGTATLDPTTGTATFTTTALNVGSNSVSAQYLANSPLENSTSSTLTQYVLTAGTYPTLVLLPVANRRGRVKRIEVLAQIEPTSPAGTPTGTATYFINGRAKMVSVFVTNGMAEIRVPARRLVNKYIFVRYNGDSSFIASVSQSYYMSQRRVLSVVHGNHPGGLHLAALRAHHSHRHHGR